MTLRANPIDVEQCIKATKFPATKNELVQFARGQHASNQIISALNGIPDKNYTSASDAARETYIEEGDLPRGQESCDD